MKSEFYGTEIFLDNEYTREYLDICRASLNRPEPDYYEEHMVIPMDFWRFLPWAVKGRLKEAMPDDKKVYCKLLPEEHFKCHELLKQMVPEGKQKSIAEFNLLRIKDAHQGKYHTAKEWGSAQRERSGGKNFTGLPEVMKYHPERFSQNGVD